MQEVLAVRDLLVNLVFQVIQEIQDHQDLLDIPGILDQWVPMDNLEAWDFLALRETLDGLDLKVRFITTSNLICQMFHCT